ncbi:MAG: 16S rRNA (cytosine(967)-C(5))-methyltransferase RsmB [Bacillota bacterium]|jgi:16S rRNA (cytosine967-C5)-methyltransferase
MIEKITTAREKALLILHKVAQEGAYANLQTAGSLDNGNFSIDDKRLITELVYGTLRMQNALDHILNQLLKKPLSDLPLWIMLILRLSLYQLLYLEKIPYSAVVNEGVKLAKRYGHRGTASLVNGVLRNYLRYREQYTLPQLSEGAVSYLTVTLSHPVWLARYLLDSFGERDAAIFCAYNNQPHDVVIRTNTIKTDRETLLMELQRRGFTAEAGAFAPEAIRLLRSAGIFDSDLFKKGFFQAQDESSMLVAHALSPRKGSKVLDLCAAPGGKTCHLAQLMKNEGKVHAFDIHEHKLDLLKENYRRLGLSIIEEKAADARYLPQEYKYWADYILLDAPCSGLGILSRRADARWRKSPQDIKTMQKLSREILLAAADYLATLGILCFSTCTITKEENQHSIQWFLQQRSDFELAAFDHLLPQSLPDEILTQAQKGMVQLLPQNAGIEGFFISRLQKKG